MQKNGRKTGRFGWTVTAACLTIFLCVGGCLVYGLHAARRYIDDSGKRSLGAVMEQLERPYITRLNTSAYLAKAMERYLFADGRREIELKADGRFLTALDGQSVLDILFVDVEGRYISLDGQSGRQSLSWAQREKLKMGKTLSGYRRWNGENAFFVVQPMERFQVEGETYDAIALAYTPGEINGMLSFYAYDGQANVCLTDRAGRIVYRTNGAWTQDEALARYDGKRTENAVNKRLAAEEMAEGKAGCVKLSVRDKPVYFAYHPIGDTSYLVVCEAACSLVQNVMTDYAALIARIAAAIGVMLAGVTVLLDVSILRLIDANHRAAYARQNELAQEKANRELESVNAALRESAERAETLRKQVQREQEERNRLYHRVSRGIRTPLNAVVGLTHLLAKAKDSETMKRYAEQIGTQVERALTVLNDERKPVDLSACTAAQVQNEEHRLEGIRVLLAEDGEMNAEIIQRLLMNAGAVCDRAADGLQALRRFEAAQTGTYQAILMDMQMPVMDGCEAARAIRQCGRADAAAIPIIAMTANTFDDVRERIFDAGMDGYLGKPVEPGRLACAVLAALHPQKND